MRIIILSQWYPPEQAPIGYMVRELAQAMVASGHKVTVITGFPNHPSGVVFGGYTKRWCLKESCDGVDVRRMYLFTKSNPGKLARVLSFLSFTVTSAWALLVNARVDLIFAVFQPLSVGLTLPILARLKRTKLVLNVQDLHPDVPIELGLIRNTWLINFLRWLEKFGYRSADGLAVICEAFKQHCVTLGAQSNKVRLIPNWIDTDEILPGNRINSFRESLGLSSDHIVVLYAGTIGLVSGAEIVLEVATLLKVEQPFVRFVFVGEGPALLTLKAKAESFELDNIVFAPFQPRKLLGEVQAMADISLVTLRRGKGRTSVPSKVLGYMAAARPVIASVDEDSETASLISRSDCGRQVSPEDVVELASMISSLAANSQLRRQLGLNGRKFLEANYKKEMVAEQYIRFLESVVQQK